MSIRIVVRSSDDVHSARDVPARTQPERVTPRPPAAGKPARPQVLFLTGAGLMAAVAMRSIAELRKSFDVIAAPADDAPAPGADTQCAEATVESAVAWLDSWGVDRAHVVGLSFGGIVAQEFALRYPDRVRSLVLCATSAGGVRSVAPESAIDAFVRHVDELPGEESLWAAVPYLYTLRTRREHAPRIGEDIAQRLGAPLDAGAIRREQSTTRRHDASARLSQIAAPTLVIHGEQDRLVPLENGRRLAAAITGAELLTLSDGGHAFPTDVPASGRELVRFLRAHSQAPRRSAARTARAARA
jgi:3-oxoadipate enol-lactonase